MIAPIFKITSLVVVYYTAFLSMHIKTVRNAILCIENVWKYFQVSQFLTLYYANTTVQKSGLLRSALVCKSCHNFYFDL